MIRLFVIAVICITPLTIIGQCVGTPGQVSWHIWEDDTPYWSLDHLAYDDTYPNGPDKVRTQNSAATYFNYDDDFGSVLKGFISVPDSGPVTFNITGDDQTVLLLSSDATKENLDTIAYSWEWNSQQEHNKFASQTSEAINMVQGQLYYFELYHKEGGGGDHASIFWQRPYLTDSTWQLITSPFLTDVCDPVCPPQGTACNDGDPSTTDDQEDGSCNCVGKPNDSGLSVGKRGELEAFFYDNIDGAFISDLTESVNYPGVPDRMINHQEGLFAQWDNQTEDYGCLIKGYLTVPVSGSYNFNITGITEVRFRLSSDSSPTNVTDSIMTYQWGTGVLEHAQPNAADVQTMTGVQLVAGHYYYFEVIQKVPGWGHRFSVFWSGPQYDDSHWHHIPDLLVYNYEDPMLCLPMGTTCDDGNPLTASDVIGADCNCAGVACEPFVDCDDPAANYIKYDYCETTDQLDTRSDHAWLSCASSVNPYIPEFSQNSSHWIHYDLGNEYLLGATHVWNYNVAGETDQGFENVTVHYSLDGVTWDLLGYYDWDLASGNANYSGFTGPDFGLQPARYVIFTSTDVGQPCQGISKITFNANLCEDKGTSCDDGDLATFNDYFDDKCQCIGYTAEELDCSIDTLFVNEEDLNPNQYHAIMALMSEGKVMNSSSVHYNAGMEIVLEAGFEVSSGSSFEANIDDCPPPSMALIESKSESEFLKRKVRPDESIQVFNLEGSEIQTLRIYLPQAARVSLNLYDQSGELITPIINHHYQNYGDHYKRLYLRKLDPGIYTVRMDTPNGSYIDKLTVLESI